MNAVPFRGYISKRYWARARWRGFWRFVRGLPSDLRRIIRNWWWIAKGQRERTIEERDRFKARAEEQFKLGREYAHAVYMLNVDNRGASVDLLRLVAEEIDCGGNAHDCDHCGLMDWSTGVTECPKSDLGECAFEKACGLRDLAAALETKASCDRDAAPREREAVEAEGQQPGPKGIAQLPYPKDQPK